MFAAICSLVLACGGDDDSLEDGASGANPTAAGDGSAPTQSADSPASGSAGGAASSSEGGGTVTVGEESWTLVPAIQCGVFPGPQVHISGHAEEDESIEILIDLDEGTDLKSVSVQADDDDPWWEAQDDAVTIEVDGRTVRGSGTFSSPFADRGTREGSFEIEC